jgi:hypothetical protein
VRVTIDRIEMASGKRPVGWLGAGLAETWNTLDYLAGAGIRYVCDWVNDDQPYLFEIGNPPLVSLPYSVQTNDVPAYFEMKVSVPEFEAVLRRQFDPFTARAKRFRASWRSPSTPLSPASRIGLGLSMPRSNTSARMAACGAPPAGRSCSTSWRSNRSEWRLPRVGLPSRACRVPVASTPPDRVDPKTEAQRVHLETFARGEEDADQAVKRYLKSRPARCRATTRPPGRKSLPTAKREPAADHLSALTRPTNCTSCVNRLDRASRGHREHARSAAASEQ